MNRRKRLVVESLTLGAIVGGVVVLSYGVVKLDNRTEVPLRVSPGQPTSLPTATRRPVEGYPRTVVVTVTVTPTGIYCATEDSCGYAYDAKNHRGYATPTVP